MNKEDLILEYLKKIDSDLKEFKYEINKRFEQIDKKFEQVDRQFVEMRQDIKDFKREIREDLKVDQKKLDEVYEARNTVTVTWSRAFVGFNAVVTAMIAIVVSLFVVK